MSNATDNRQPSNWEIISNNGTTLTAINLKTRDQFSGTSAQFESIIRGNGKEELAVSGEVDKFIVSTLTSNKYVNLGSLSHIFNFDPKNYKKSRAAFSSVRAGVSNATIYRIGDSTEVGKGATGVGATAGARPFSPTKLIADMLTTSGITAKANTFSGDYNLGDVTTLKAYDTRIATTGATNVWFGVSALTGAPIRFPSAASSVTFTADVACDTWEIIYLDNSAAQFSWQIGAGATTQINQANTAALVKATVSGTAATSLTLTWVSGTVGIWSVRGYNAATKEVSVFTAAFLGAESASFTIATQYYTALNQLKNVAPNLSIIRLGINDWNQGTPISVATYKANIQTIITAAQISGDVILVTPVPSQITGTMTLAGQQAYIQALYELAVANNCALVDVWTNIDSYEISNSLGYYTDNAHLSKFGYNDLSKTELQLLNKL